VCPRGLEVAPAELEFGALPEEHVGVVGGDGAKRGGAGAVGFVPVAGREQGLDTVGDQHGAVDAVAAHDLEARRRQPCRFPRPSQHRQHVGVHDVHPLQHDRIAALLGKPQGLPEAGKALVAAAEVGKVGAEHDERPQLSRLRPDRERERQCPLADHQRLVVAPGHHQSVCEGRQRLGPFRRGRLRRRELDGAL
jgi:hypothetical protein